jgi:hypothetical protein
MMENRPELTGIIDTRTSKRYDTVTLVAKQIKTRDLTKTFWRLLEEQPF